MSPRPLAVLCHLLPLLLLGAAPPPASKARPGASRDVPLLTTRIAPPPTGTPKHAPTKTRCEVCHSPAGWKEARFEHGRTGFPLLGAHQKAGCKQCHTGGFDAPLPRNCASCHRDTHQGEFGQRCEGCHETDDWQALFTADAHRRTNFPLSGRHAVLPCQECHAGQSGPTFSRATVECLACHQRDYERTAVTSIDHAALGFGTECRQCHDAWRFTRARFPGHDACFQINGGEHAGLPCLSCHTSLVGLRPTGACATRTAACSGCHEHSCARNDREHREVPGYQCKDQKCYECHRFAVKP